MHSKFGVPRDFDRCVNIIAIHSNALGEKQRDLFTAETTGRMSIGTMQLLDLEFSPDPCSDQMNCGMF